MKVTGWGKYPVIEARIMRPTTSSELAAQLQRAEFQGIARGLGRSYGDSSLGRCMVELTALDHFHSFAPESGILSCGAGVSLEEILHYFVPRGWFLPVTPGTKFVTVGGAIASDVHGKNHHCHGTFCDHLISLRLALPSGEIVTCSPTDNRELFLATCGGMGLTGIIVEAAFYLQPIQSAYIKETTIKAANLAEALALFEEYGGIPYSVAWIDCLAAGPQLGRSLLMLGEHCADGALISPPGRALSIPCDMPAMLLNRYSIQAFNTLYYQRVRHKNSQRIVHYEPFFYPLDGIHHWNRLYGKTGFTQYQFVLPKAAGVHGITTVLTRIARSGRGSFLAVLKAFGKGNENLLSFPLEGYTLALDFKIAPGLLPFLDELDRIVLEFGGRLYLTKDVRMSAAMFQRSYPRWQRLAAVRKHYGAETKFSSLQSQRLEI